MGTRLDQDHATSHATPDETKQTAQWAFARPYKPLTPPDDDSCCGKQGMECPTSLTVPVLRWQSLGHAWAAGACPAHPRHAHPARCPQRTGSGPSGTGRPRCCWTLRPRRRRRATRRWPSTCSSSASPSSTSSTSSRPACSSPPSPSSSTSFRPRVPAPVGGEPWAQPGARGDSR